MVLFTDGVTEAENEDREEFGQERLSEKLSARIRLKPNEFNRRLLADLDEFSSASHDRDDATIVTSKESDQTEGHSSLPSSKSITAGKGTQILTLPGSQIRLDFLKLVQRHVRHPHLDHFSIPRVHLEILWKQAGKLFIKFRFRRTFLDAFNDFRRFDS